MAHPASIVDQRHHVRSFLLFFEQIRVHEITAIHCEIFVCETSRTDSNGRDRSISPPSLSLSLARSFSWNASRFDPSTITESSEKLRDCCCNSNRDTREITSAISRQPFSLLAEQPEGRLLFSTLSMSKGTQGRQIPCLLYPVLVVLTALRRSTLVRP